MRICVIGAGAMGSLYGMLLARSGVEVVLLDSWTEHVEAIRRDGLRLDGITGELWARLPAFTTPAEVPQSDLALVHVDTNATAAAAEAAAGLLRPGGYAVTLQNGVGNVEALAERLGRERVVGGLSYHSAAMLGPAHARHTHAGPTWLGELDGRRSDRVVALEQMLDAAGFEPVIVDDIMGYIWNKFVHNCAINPVCAATGLRVGEIPLTPAADQLQTRIIEETLAVVRAKGIVLPEADPMAAIKAFCRLKFNQPSMLQHVGQGKRTEIDALNGAVVREGRALGIATPFSEALVLVIKGLEAQRQQALHGPARDYAEMEAQAQRAAG